jgi:FixJ family two-component response regulator
MSQRRGSAVSIRSGNLNRVGRFVHDRRALADPPNKNIAADLGISRHGREPSRRHRDQDRLEITSDADRLGARRGAGARAFVEQLAA